MIEQKAKIVKNKVKYNCPKCGSPLSNPINEIGQQDVCPTVTCRASYLVPGKELLPAYHAELAAAAKAESAEKQQSELRTAKAANAKAAKTKAKRQTAISTTPRQPATQIRRSKMASATRPVGTAEKLLFTVTRVFVFIICVLASLGLIANLIWLLAIFVWPPPSTRVSTGEIIAVVNQPEPQKSVEEERKNDVGQNAGGQIAKFEFRGYWKNDLDEAFENVTVRPELVKILQSRLTDELNLTLLFSLRNLSRENKQELIDELTAFLSTNKVADKKLQLATELFVKKKSKLLDSRSNYGTKKVARISLAATAVVSSLGTIALFSLVLVLLAIERNTRTS